MSRVLVIEAEEQTCELIAYDISTAGHEVVTASTVIEGLNLARKIQPDLVISELILPDGPGTEICRALRAGAELVPVPFIILSERNDEVDRVRAFELGIDDYVAKPFSPRELVLRVRAILRRTTRNDSKATVIGCMRLDRPAHRVWVEGDVVHLTSTEYQILLTFCEHVDEVLSREGLIARLWEGGSVDVRTVDAYVRRLRLRLGPAGKYIETVRGAGYRLSPEAGMHGGSFVRDQGPGDSDKTTESDVASLLRMLRGPIPVPSMSQQDAQRRRVEALVDEACAQRREQAKCQERLPSRKGRS